MAAGVTDRLWEMTDVVDMLDAFEAKRKREPKVHFEIERWRIGGGFYIRATVERIDGFLSESEAQASVRNESAAWLYGQRTVGKMTEHAFTRPLYK
jgi:hypothetical protein